MNPPDAQAIRAAAFHLILTGGAPRLTAVSDGVQALLGYPAADFRSGQRALPSLIHPDDRDIADPLFSPAGQPSEGVCNLRLRPASGRILCVQGVYRREAAADGVVLDLQLHDAKNLPRTMAAAHTAPMFAAMMENTDDYIYFKDRNHVFTGASQTLVALCSPAEHWTDLIGQTDYDVFPEEFADRYYRLEKQIFAGLTVAHEVQQTLAKDGRRGWVDNRKYPIRDASGTLIGLYGIARDITALVQAEHERSLHSEILKNVKEGIHLVRLADGLIVYANERFEKMFGYEPGEMIGKDVAIVNAPGERDPAETKRAITAILVERGEWHGEIENIRKDGTRFWCEAHVSSFEHAQYGRVHVSVHTDITARKQAEALLKTERERFKTILETAVDPLFVKDDAHRMVAANRAFCEMFALDLDTVIGRTLAENVPADERQRFLAVDRQVLDTGRADVREESLTVGGVTKTIVTKKSRFTEASGQNFLVGAIHDITLPKQAGVYSMMAREILHLLNEPGELLPIIQRIIGKLKSGTGLDAVGIRLRSGDDFPYFAQEGFPAGFLLTENTLVAKGTEGGICRNPDGSASLECTCGLVISGKSDATNKLFTPGGSCWMNDSFPLLNIPVSEDPRLHPRNVCIHRGYASIALVPIRAGEKIEGLIQFNDRRKGCFSLVTVELLEGIAAHIGTALVRRQAEEVLRLDNANAARMRRALLSTLEDQKRAQSAVREREARYGAMVSSIADAIVSTDAAGRITGWNPGAETIFGYPESEILGQPLTLLLPTRHHDLPAEDPARAAAGGSSAQPSSTSEAEGRRKDGSEFPLSLSLSEWETGGQKFTTAIIRDITESKASQQEIDRLNRIYRVISQIGHVIVHAKTRIELFSGVCRVLHDSGRLQMAWVGWLDPTTQLLVPVASAGDDHGYVPRLQISASPDDASGQGPSGTAFRENRIAVCNDFFADPTTAPWHEAARRSGFQSSISLPLRLENQSRGVLTVYAAEKNYFGPKEIALLTQSTSDVSFALDAMTAEERRQQAETQLRKLSAIVEQAPLSVVITNLTGAIEYVNPRFCLVTGYTPAEVLGQNPRVLKSGVTPPEVYRTMWETLSRGAVWSGELSNRAKNGELYLETAVIAPVFDNHGRATHYVALKDDITAKQRHEAELNAKLAREHELSEMKTRFISVTSHEFRTPMAAAMGSVEILANHLDRLAPEKRQVLLARITSSLHRMTAMLDEVLLLNRMDANRVEVRLAPLDLPAFVQQIVEEIRLGDRDEHRFDFHAAGEARDFPSDSNLLHHILSNLLSNAVRFSPAGSLVTVHLVASAGQAQVAVEDRGIGIPAADQVRIFEAFERGSNVGAIKGTGLGLNIVQRMTTLLGGTVALAGGEGGGSCFTVTLPRLPLPPPAP